MCVRVGKKIAYSETRRSSWKNPSMTQPAPTLSVVITNYNYAKFVATAIESLLSQSPRPQIIVVDDCSTDNSREIIAQYSDQITAVLQDVNQGHGGGFNAGFERTTGDLVMFLDADDFMLPGAINTILNHYHPTIDMYHYRMRYADGDGNLGGFHPRLSQPMAEGDVSATLRNKGDYAGTITSGLVFSRRVLEQVLPMDSERYRQGGDGYLSATVPLYGHCASFDEAISGYRLHAEQHSKFAKHYAKRARWAMGHKQECYRSIYEHSEKLGLTVMPNLDEQDPSFTINRLTSLVFEPESHPFEADAVSTLADKAKRFSVTDKSGVSKLTESLWWQMFRLAPAGQKRTLLTWKIDADARPAWIQASGRFVRKRLLGK